MLEENGEEEWSEKVTNEQVLEHIEEKRTLLNNILLRKANWIDHILRNCLLHDNTEVQMMEVKGVRRIRTQLLDHLRGIRYWEEAED